MSSSISSSPTPKPPRRRLSSRSWLLIIALLGFAIGIPGYVFSAQNYASHYGFRAQNGKTLNIATARGETIALAVQIEDGIAGNWASNDGLTLTLNEINTQLTVVGPKEETWGDSIETTSNDSGRYLVKGNVTIPSSIGGPEQRSLSGTLSGSIDYPSGGFLFQDKTINVNVPVKIQLEPQASVLWSGGRLTFYAVTGFEILCGAVLVALAIQALRRAAAEKRATPPEIRRRHTSKQRLENLAGGAFAAVMLTGLGGLFLWAGSNGDSPAQPGELIYLSFLVCGLVGLSALLGILASMESPRP